MANEPATAGVPEDSAGSASAPEASPSSSLSSRSPRRLLAAVRARPRRATLVVALSALAVVGLISVGLAYRPNPVSVVMGPSSVVLGSDGIPTQVDGQRVYRVTEQADWQNLNGSFLLAAYVFVGSYPCPRPVSPQPQADSDLLARCGTFDLAPNAGQRGRTGPGSIYGISNVAPLGSDVLFGWMDGPAVVIRAHTHDVEAPRCGADVRAACESALVVEAVVWPTVPTEIAGEHVYRHGDQASFAKLKGSFLLGGPLVRSNLESPCMWPIASEWEAVIALTGACPYPSIDGLSIAEKSTIDEARDEIVVARVHANDPQAADCPSDYRAYCEAAIVVESVVWRAPAS